MEKSNGFAKVLFLCIFRPKKMAHLPTLWTKYQYSLNIKTVTLTHLQMLVNLMSKFWENFKNVNLGTKMTHLHHFEQNMNFPYKSKTVTFTHSLIPDIWYNFKKLADLKKKTKKCWFCSVKYPILIHFSHENFLLKMDFVNFVHCVKCPNTEFFLVGIFLYSDWIRRFTTE